MAVYQKITHGEVLGKPDHGVVYGGIAVGMVFAQHIAHAGGRLFEGLVRGQEMCIRDSSGTQKNAPGSYFPGALVIQF